MRAEDLVPGLYWAHDRDICEVHSVTYSTDRNEVCVDYTYLDERRPRHWTPIWKEWSVVPYWEHLPTYVINEIGVLV